MTHKLGVYWAPQHDQQPHLDFIRRLRPTVIRVLTEDVQHISDAHKAAPDAIIVPRVYRVDDDNGRAGREVRENPIQAAKTHVRQLVAYVEMWRKQAAERNIPFPDIAHIRLAHANELNQHCTYPQIAEYAKYFILECAAFGYKSIVCVLGSGHPASPGDKWWTWKDFESLQPYIDKYDAWVEVHNYWQREGPFHTWTDGQGNLREDYPALAGRHHHCSLRCTLLVGESGVDGTIYNRNPQWGWGNYGMSVDEYVGQIADNHDALAPNAIAMLIFMSDIQADEWKGYELSPCYPKLLNVMSTKDAVFDNSRSAADFAGGGADDDAHNDDFKRAIEFVLSWEGGYVNNPNDPGGETNFGITKRSYPDEDIKNMTRERAIMLMKRDFWDPIIQKHGLEWPLNIVVFDTAILHGPQAARFWLQKYGIDNPDEWSTVYAFLYERARVYLESANRELFADGWTNRLKALKTISEVP